MTTPQHLYMVHCEIDGEMFVSPCVGEEELKDHVSKAESFGARMQVVMDIEIELRRFIFDCYFEGALKEWDRQLGKH